MEVFSSRGVYYLPGRVRCPLAEVGTRGAYDSNRLALDDGDTQVSVDRGAARITVRNPHLYARKRVVADLLFLAEGRTAAGAPSPLAVHLKIMKVGTRWKVDLHRHLRTHAPLVAAELEPFEVVATDGVRERVLLTPERARALVCRPPLGLRLIKAVMALRDNSADEPSGSPCVADLSVGFGALGLEYMVARARLEAPPPRPRSVAETLRQGAWELRITALSTRWLPEVVQRDLFLFGLDGCELLAPLRERGLGRGQALCFRFRAGKGEVGLDGRWAELPSALDVARAYVEFHMLGGLLAEAALRAPHQGAR
jgi:hypothetical protein